MRRKDHRHAGEEQTVLPRYYWMQCSMGERLVKKTEREPSCEVVKYTAAVEAVFPKSSDGRKN